MNKLFNCIAALSAFGLLAACDPMYRKANAIRPEVGASTRSAPTQQKPRAKLAEMCGGFAGIHCDGGLYCDFGDGASAASSSCGSNDHAGRCAQVPQMCTQDYAPVCGCDANTYGNACSAHSRGITVATAGACPPH